MDYDRTMKVIEEAERLQLEGLELLEYVSDEEAAREYNGIGPEYLPPEIRDKVTKFVGLFEPAALIHDLRNYLSDGGVMRFDHANLEFLRNCRKCANDRYPWWSWKRWRARAVAKMMFDFVSSEFGWRAWMDCYNKTINQ